MHLQFEEGFIDEMEALDISKLFESYGDFFLYKETHSSIYMEFFFIDPQMVPSKQVQDLLVKLTERADLKILKVQNHREAPKFKAHTNYDAK